LIERLKIESKMYATCHGNQLSYLVRGPYQNLLHPT
jgi:hypothetical protein